MDRREFIKGLVAAGVAAGIPLKEAEAVAVHIDPHMLKVPGKVLARGMEPLNNGFFKIWVEFDVNQPDDMDLSDYAVDGQEPSLVFDAGDGAYVGADFPRRTYEGQTMEASVIIKPREVEDETA